MGSLFLDVKFTSYFTTLRALVNVVAIQGNKCYFVYLNIGYEDPLFLSIEQKKAFINYFLKTLWNVCICKNFIVLFMYGIKFKSFPKFIFEWKICWCMGLSVCNICTIFQYRRSFIIVQLFRPWLRHNRLRNSIRVLRWVCGEYSYVSNPCKNYELL